MGDSFKDVLDFAIEQEREAAAFYTQLAEQVQAGHVRSTLLEFAAQERGHENRLRALRTSATTAPAAAQPADLRIADYLVDVQPAPGLSYQAALVVAMKREKAAFAMYRQLAALATDPAQRELFLFLAGEEATHKLAFEVEYDDLVNQEN